MSQSEALPPRGRSRRNLICLLGLPIDVVDLSTAVATVRHAALTKRRCFISTPNLNFLMAAQNDEAFRESVLRSDLCLADGVSLLALARMVGAPLPERVSGADLFERLCASTEQPPIKVFFLGGPAGAAKLASERVNREATGMRCVGYDEAGFGDIPSISGQDLIDKINASEADFVVVSLGAKKGQAWIMHNQMRLTAPVICHLGAVVNFTAGTIRRAPRWMQKHGLEWLWRAMTEQGLYKRYWDDGRAFLSIIARHTLTVAGWWRRLKRLVSALSYRRGEVLQDQCDQGVRSVRLAGHWGRHNATDLAALLAASEVDRVEVNAGELDWLSLHAIGTLASHHGQMRAAGGAGVFVRNASDSLRRHLESVGVGYLLATAPCMSTNSESAQVIARQT